MPGLEAAMDPRPEIRERTSGGPQGPERTPVGGGQEAVAMTVPVRTRRGEKFALVPSQDANGQRLEPEQAMQMVKTGELEPIGVYPSMEEAEQAKAKLGGGEQQEGPSPEQPGGLEAAMAAMGGGQPQDKQAAMKGVRGDAGGRY